MLQLSDSLIVTLDDYRAQMKQARVDTEPGGIYFDGSPVGSGKSFLNAQHVQRYASSRTLVKTHAAAAETLQAYVDAGVEDVAAYPKLSRDNCRLYATASRAQTLGLNVGLGVCTGCPYYESCKYRIAIHSAEQAPHQILSHDRGRVRPASLRSSELIIIEEDAIDFLRPKFDAANGFDAVVSVASLAISRTFDSELRFAFEQIHRVAVDYLKLVQPQVTAMELERPTPIPKPDGMEKLLCDCLPRSISGYALKIVLGTVFGDWDRIMLVTDDLWNAEQKTREPKARVIAIGKTEVPKNAEMWITDATGSFVQLSTVFPQVEDRTPQAHIELQHPIRQVPVDVCKSSNSLQVSRLLRRLLGQYCHGERVGLITHQEFLPQRLDLTDDERDQIVLASYFGSGDTVGSNIWYTKCDKLLILGTPRPAPYDIRTRAIQMGFGNQVIHPDFDYVCQDGDFRRYSWDGETVDGRKAKVYALGYRKEGWRLAAASLVQDTLDQAAGRGRGFLKSGVPVILVTTEPMGYTLLELPPRQAKLCPVYDAIYDGLDSVSEICMRVGKSERTVRRCVNELEERGEVARESERGRIVLAPPAPPASDSLTVNLV